MIVYDIDKVLREEMKVNFMGKKYQVKEPTVRVWGEINRDLDKKLSKGEIEGYKWLIKKMIPELSEKVAPKKISLKNKLLRKKITQDTSSLIDKATRSEMVLIVEVCLKVLSGKGSEGKKLAPVDVMRKV